MKAGKMPSSIKMCCSKLWGWAAEEDVSLGGESEGRGGSNRSDWHGTHGEGIVCVGKLGCERDLGQGTFKLSISDIDLFHHETPFWNCEQSQHI